MKTVLIISTLLALCASSALAGETCIPDYSGAFDKAYQYEWGMVATPELDYAVQQAYLQKITTIQQGIAICSTDHGGDKDVKNTVCVNVMIDYLRMLSFYAQHPNE